MALSVQTNMNSLIAASRLGRTQSSLSGTLGRISSGLRISRAADDAAGFAVAEQLDAVNRSLDAAARNTNDAISMLQIAEGASNEIGETLKRVRQLVLQSASETLDNTERAYLQTEVTELARGLDHLARSTNFNGVNLADGSVPSVDVQVGEGNGAGDTIRVSLLNLRSLYLGIATIDVTTSAGASLGIDAVDVAMRVLNRTRANYAASQNRLTATLSNLATYSNNLSASRSRIMDADFARETAQLAKHQTMQQAGIAILGQANAMNQGALRLVG